MIRRLLARWRNRHDAALQVQTDPRPAKGAVPYLSEKASAGYRRSRTQTESGRPLPKPKAKKPATVEKLAPKVRRFS